MIDTRPKLLVLLDYKEYYGIDKSIEDAEELIKNIPSQTLLNYISGFSVFLYLNENNELAGKIQFALVSDLLNKCSITVQQKWVTEVKRQDKMGNTPIMFWNYSNLLFYGLIFKTFNDLDSRDITGDEAKRLFDAYLIINGIANRKVQIDEETIKKADEEKRIEEVIMPSFIYQKDYASSLDFSNQVIRGVAFFQYLENDSKYKTLIKEYYVEKNVSGYLRMFRNLMVLFSELRIGEDLAKRKQLVDLYPIFINNDVDMKYVETLCINSEIKSYSADNSFSILRNKFLYQLNEFKFLLLNINFLLDQFYKAQIFSFNAFLKAKGIKGDFLSEKGKNFTESTYLPMVLNTCFPHYIKFYADACINSNNEELCDAYLRDSNKVCLVEFKDVLLNASIKNSADKVKLFAEFDKKIVSNQTNKPKGITQLINAIKDIDSNSIAFDTIYNNLIEIYPVIIYTDLSFGIEGINKLFKEKFRKELEKENLKNVIVKNLTFINLNYFEVHEDYFGKNILDFFQILDGYHKHTSNSDFSLTPLEIFSRSYMKENVVENLKPSMSFKYLISSIINAK